MRLSAALPVLTGVELPVIAFPPALLAVCLGKAWFTCTDMPGFKGTECELLNVSSCEELIESIDCFLNRFFAEELCIAGS